MRVIGLTGGVGSGKSTVAAHFRQQGLPVIDADELAKQAVVKGSPGLSEIVARFGTGILDSHGNLNRRTLAELVFGDSEALAALNAIVHPKVAQLLKEQLTRLGEHGHSLACYEVPLLYENKLEQRFSPVVVVSVPPETQIKRAMARSGWTEQEARARVAAQMPLSDKASKADYLITNDGSLQHTYEQADAVLKELFARFGS